MQRIGIAGAGIGGLAAALALAGPERRVLLFERTAVLGEVGAGLQLSSNACAALRRLGVLDDVSSDAVALQALRIGRGRDGAILARLPLGEAAEHRYGAPFLVTRRADLHRALRRRAEASPMIELATGAGIAGWSVSGPRLRLAFDNGGAPVEVDALVGADGLRSLVRSGLSPEAAPWRGRGVAWRATIEATRVPASAREACSNLWLGHGAHIVHYPVAGGRLINVVAAIDGALPSTSGNAGWSDPGDPAEIAGRFATWSEPVRHLLAAAPAWGKWPLVDRPSAKIWSGGPVTLLGDAAHPMLPFLAQGAAQALEDAVALGEAVASQPHDLAAAFEVYAHRRCLRTARVQAESRRQATIYHLGRPASIARDLVLRATPSARLLSRYDWLYAATPR